MAVSYSLLVTEADGNTITAANRNAEHQNHIDNISTGLSGSWNIEVATLDVSGNTTIDGSGTHTLSEKFAQAATGISTMDQSIVNLGITISGGTLTITDAGGAALSASNPGYITMQSTTSGVSVDLKVTGTYAIDDLNGTSNFTNLGFGISESRNWGKDMPFFIYAINRGNSDFDGVDGNSTFVITRNFAMKVSPSAGGNIGDTVAIPTTDDQTSVIAMANITPGNYIGRPVMPIGTISMQLVQASADWLFTGPLFNDGDAIGKDALRRVFSREYEMPLGQNGADANNHFSQTSGSAATWAGTLDYSYTISSDGFMHVHMTTANGGNATASVTAAQIMSLTLPYALSSTYYGTAAAWAPIGSYLVTGASVIQGVCLGLLTTAAPRLKLYESALGSIDGDEFTGAADDITVDVRLKVYG